MTTRDRNFEVVPEFLPFLLYDSGSDNHERILIFGDHFMVNQLEASNFWLADGTFKLTPKVFYQLYTIHIQISDIAPACVYALLPNKTEATYNRFLKALLDFAPSSSPSKILIHFELAAATFSFRRTIWLLLSLNARFHQEDCRAWLEKALPVSLRCCPCIEAAASSCF